MDTVERLRKPVMYHRNAEQTNAERAEAADEIERLRWELAHTTLVADADRRDLKADIERLRHELYHYNDTVKAFHAANKMIEQHEDEIERLRTELKGMGLSTSTRRKFS